MVYIVLLLDNRKYITNIQGVFELEETAQEYIDECNESYANRLIIEEYRLN